MLDWAWNSKGRGRNFILKKFVEMEETELAKRINALDGLEDDAELEDDDFESLDF